MKAQSEMMLHRDRPCGSPGRRFGEQQAVNMDKADIRFHLRDVQYLQPRPERREHQLHVLTALILVHEGEGVLELADRKRLVRKGDFIVCPAGSTSLFYFHTPSNPSDASNSGLATMFHFDAYRWGENFQESPTVPDTTCPWLPSSGKLASQLERIGVYCRSIFEHFYSGEDRSLWLARIEFEHMLHEISLYAGTPFSNDRIGAVESTKAFIDQHYADELSLEKLAGLAELSPKYFAEQFKKYYAVSPMEYVAEVRLRKAKQLLASGSGPMKEIAHAVGYRDEFYFSRKFKKSFGVSPSAYLKTRHTKIAVFGTSAILGYLAALDAAPYAAPLHPKWSPYYYRTMGPDIPVHLNAYLHRQFQQENLEQIQAAQPELILCPSGVQDWELDVLRKCSRVYEIEGAHGEKAWREQLKDLGALLHREEEADAWLAKFDELLAEAKQSLSSIIGGARVLPIRLFNDNFYVSGDEGASETLFTQLGLVPSEMLNGLKPGDSRRSTLAEIRKSDADLLLLVVRQDSRTLEHWRSIQRHPDWLSLPQVKRGAVYVMSSYPWREYSPTAFVHMIQDLLRISGN
ncbi:helix-turn-helix domain-containing protein [Paenibacillus antibioticophila]|uniref:helix-turn-helix domain-containing protein n=1 Tax=Paenibacillus antibioticophila TaxID=1274374 RepID=UPI001BB3A794|nr:helix-turn-helix domain-containing protein [Paenibacillus antibioticophila]